MIIVLQVAGVVAVLVGLVTIGVGIPVKEFSFGNTLILSGTVGLCTGLILLGLSVVAWELRLVARRLAAAPRPATDPRAKAALPPFPAQPGEGPVFSREPSMAAPNAGQAKSPVSPPVAPPLDAEAAASAPPQPPKQRRNLMFASSVRKDRERPPARPGDPTAPDLRAPPAAEPDEAPPASFEDAWPRPDRARSAEVPPQRRASRLAPAEINRQRRGGATGSVWTASCARRAAADSDGAEIRRRRRHGLFALFRRFHRGADAGRHDAVCLDR